MPDRGLRETLEQTLNALAEPGFPTDRAAFPPPCAPTMRSGAVTSARRHSPLHSSGWSTGAPAAGAWDTRP